jgi:hypothetical protein
MRVPIATGIQQSLAARANRAIIPPRNSAAGSVTEQRAIITRLAARALRARLFVITQLKPAAMGNAAIMQRNSAATVIAALAPF